MCMIVVLMLKNHNLKLSQIWVGINSLLALVLTIISDFIVPEQFLRDSNYFDQVLSSSISGFSGPVSLIGSIYSFIGVRTPGITLRLISATIFIINVRLMFRCFDLQLEKKSQYFITTLCFLLIPFYGSGYSKELLVAIANILILSSLYRFKNILFLYFPMVSILIAITLRPYYLMTLLFFFTVYFIIIFIKTFIGRILCVVLILCAIVTVEYRTKLILKFTSIDILNIRTNSQSALRIMARSQIEQVEPTGNFLHNLFALVRLIWSMILPYSGVAILPYIVVALGINLAVWVIVLKSLSVARIHNKSTVLATASFIVAFTMTATFFEVDAGSFVRHFFPYLPLGVIILESTSKKREKK